MGKQRTEVSKNKPYYIPKYRFLELKYYCMQVCDYIKEFDEIDSMSKNDISKDRVQTSDISDPVTSAFLKKTAIRGRLSPYRLAIKKLKTLYSDEMVNMVATGAVEDIGYDILIARIGDVPCSKAKYYEAYHWFFYFLDKYRK